MESLTDEQVRHVAKLARLKLGDAEIHQFAQQLSGVLAYVSKLNQLDLTDVEPMVHAMETADVLRDDQPQPGLPVEDVLRNAPDRIDAFFAVPKVIGESGA